MHSSNGTPAGRITRNNSAPEMGPANNASSAITRLLNFGVEPFLVGASLYTHGNVWGIANPPADWNAGSEATAAAGPAPGPSAANISPTASDKMTWPYDRFSAKGEAHPAKK